MFSRAGIDPNDGEPFGNDLEGIFSLYRDRNVPADGEVIVMFVDGRPLQPLSKARGGQLNLDAQIPRWGRLTRPSRGEFETPTDSVRYVAVPVRPSGTGPRGVFVVAASLSAERDDVNEAVRLAALVLLSVLLIASALAWVVAGRVLAPLRALDETARSISETDLTRRIPVTGDDEIGELARTFNAMVDRLERAFASQRAFVSDASHELRTPITIVRGHLELLGDDPHERRETIALVTDELDRMSRFVNDLLLLAKAERNDFLRIGEVELGALTDELFDKAAGLGRREWALEARAEARLARRPSAAHASRHGAGAERRPAHVRRRRRVDRDGRRRRVRVAVGARQRPGRLARGPDTRIRALRAGQREPAPLGGRGARAGDRARDRRGARGSRRARESAR